MHVIIFSFESQLFICVLPEVGRYVLKATRHTWRPRSQLVGVNLFLPSYGSWGFNSGPRV